MGRMVPFERRGTGVVELRGFRAEEAAPLSEIRSLAQASLLEARSEPFIASKGLLPFMRAARSGLGGEVLP